MSEHHLDLVRQLLDRQVVDKNHIYCGKVDNIVLDLKGKPKVKAILIGNGAASDRLPEFARWLSRIIFGRTVMKIPWSDVLIVGDEVKLASDAKDHKLDERRGLVYDLVSKLPGAWKK